MIKLKHHGLIKCLKEKRVIQSLFFIEHIRRMKTTLNQSIRYFYGTQFCALGY